MKLTHATSYAVHALVYIAIQKENPPFTSYRIAHARGIPERFLLKLLKRLVAARLLFSIKGPNGGYGLARAADEITLLDVIEVVDGPIRGETSFSPDDTAGDHNQRLDEICAEVAEHVRQQLAKVKISRLASR